MAGKVTVGLALQWPYITDLSGLCTYELNSLREGDEHHPIFLKIVAVLYLFMTPV